MLFIPDLVLLKIDSLHLLLSLCVKVVGRYRGHECVHTSVAGHDEPAVPASGWYSPGMNLSESARESYVSKDVDLPLSRGEVNQRCLEWRLIIVAEIQDSPV